MTTYFLTTATSCQLDATYVLTTARWCQLYDKLRLDHSKLMSTSWPLTSHHNKMMTNRWPLTSWQQQDHVNCMTHSDHRKMMSTSWPLTTAIWCCILCHSKIMSTMATDLWPQQDHVAGHQPLWCQCIRKCQLAGSNLTTAMISP